MNQDNIYDAIIVGARCAGSPTAMLLARKGYRVLLLDRATFPSDIMSGHLIHPSGVALLKRWGLLDKVAASNCPPIRQVKFDFGPASFVGHGPSIDGVSDCYGVRRKYLDKILVDAATEAGAELREGFSVQEILMDGDRVTGIRGRMKNGQVVTEKARIVIGADGINSLVARSVKAATYNERPSLTGCYYSYWSNFPMECGEVYIRDGRFISTEPTNDGLTQLFVQFPYHEFQEFRKDIEGNFLKTLELTPDLAKLASNAQRQEPFVGTSNNINFFRKAFGNGWALVGDARYHRDPLTAQGITNSFQDAQVLADAIDTAFSGYQPLEVTLAGYELQRDAEVMPIYDLTCQLAALEPLPPFMLQLLNALCNNPTDASQFFGIVGGAVSASEFYAPENIQRILGTAENKRSPILSA
ncbi:NAD(P)/FAD-dependent oxidoreductase [Nostoc sp.]|uniref:NAD(P)/FAD-dependent oxidoreductase n=1 Tax=Nostoc sp. TaxID=1180 RepID=UPI002FF4796E